MRTASVPARTHSVSSGRSFMALLSDNSAVEQAVALAQNLANTFEAKGGTLSDLLAAFAGALYARDERVGHDCLIALDRFVCGEPDLRRRARRSSPISGVEVTPEMVEAFRKACREWKNGAQSYSDPVGLEMILSAVLQASREGDAGSDEGGSP